MKCFCDCSFDVRAGNMSQAKPWSSPEAFGSRAVFRVGSFHSGAELQVHSVTATDQGVYRCRVDFRNSPTRNFKVNLTVVGEWISSRRSRP